MSLFDRWFDVRRAGILRAQLVFETLVAVVMSALLTIVQEVWRLIGRLVDSVTAILLGFLNKQAFEHWWNVRRGRIVVISEDTLEFGLIEHEFDLVLVVSLGWLTFQNPNESSSSPTTDAPVKSQPMRMLVKPKKRKHRASIPEFPVNPSWETVDDNVTMDFRGGTDEMRLFAHERLTTGFFEDIMLGVMVAIENIRVTINNYLRKYFTSAANLRYRALIKPFFRLSFYLSLIWWYATLPYYLVRLFVSMLRAPVTVPRTITTTVKSVIKRQFRNIDNRDRGSSLLSKGYAFEQHPVVTQDGHILSLERLARPDSRKVYEHTGTCVYLQHGVFDSAHAWFSDTQREGMNVAFRAYDLGYDVYAGTLRGCSPEKHHIDPNISAHDYWNFTVNEHAFGDIPAFIRKIHEIKTAEGIPVEEIQIHAVSHSMGAMATLMYVVRYSFLQRPHYLASMVLLSPAGVHTTAPLLCRLTGPLISAYLKWFPWATNSFRFPSDLIRVFAAKMIEDVRNNYSTRNLLSYLVYKFLGGTKSEHAYTRAHNLTYNVFAGTSAGIFKHFWQIYKTQEFCTFDYGRKGNLRYYGSEAPFNVLQNYKCIRIPTCFVMGLRDTLIEPVSVLIHYNQLFNSHPDKAYLKAFPNKGHIDFTVGENSDVSNYIFGMINEFTHQSPRNIPTE